MKKTLPITVFFAIILINKGGVFATGSTNYNLDSYSFGSYNGNNSSSTNYSQETELNTISLIVNEEGEMITPETDTKENVNNTKNGLNYINPENEEVDIDKDISETPNEEEETTNQSDSDLENKYNGEERSNTLKNILLYLCIALILSLLLFFLFKRRKKDQE